VPEQARREKAAQERQEKTERERLEKTERERLEITERERLEKKWAEVTARQCGGRRTGSARSALGGGDRPRRKAPAAAADRTFRPHPPGARVAVKRSR
jgi:hypothetical protein